MNAESPSGSLNVQCFRRQWALIRFKVRQPITFVYRFGFLREALENARGSFEFELGDSRCGRECTRNKVAYDLLVAVAPTYLFAVLRRLPSRVDESTDKAAIP